MYVSLKVAGPSVNPTLLQARGEVRDSHSPVRDNALTPGGMKSPRGHGLGSGQIIRVGICFLDRPALPRTLELARMAEARGFDSAWVCETRLARDAISVLGSLAAVTQRIKLGSGVINTWTRGPALTAMTVATLDELAPGRILLGLGAYWHTLAWKQGIEWRQPLRKMREFVEVTRRLLTLERFTFEGELVQVRDLQLDLSYGAARRPRRIPIYIGATRPRMLRLAGAIADGVLLNGLLSPDYTRQCIHHVRLGARQVGRDPGALDLPQLINVALDREGARARDAARRLIATYIGQQPHIAAASGLPDDALKEVRARLGGWPPSEHGVERAAELISDTVVGSLAVAGTADQCRAALERFLAAGISYPVIVPITQNIEEIIELFAVTVPSQPRPD
jgi:5,10-methylenetetrahydromethanopterin reductase